MSEAVSLDPRRLNVLATGMERGLPIYDSLLRLEADGTIVPWRAAGMTSTDNVVWTLTLRDDVTFTDETPLDADAVVYNIDRHRAPDSLSVGKGQLADVVDVRAVDELTVQITLGTASGGFPTILTAESPVGFIGSPTAVKADPEGFGQHPVGAGPFMVEEWVRDDHLTLVRNPDCWQEGLPRLDSLRFVITPDDQSRVDTLRTGGIDLTAGDPANYRAILGDDRFVVHPQSGAQFIFLNESTIAGQDQRLRRAIQLAFDPDEAEAVIFGPDSSWDGDTSCLPFFASSGLCLEEAVEPDREEARRLVAEYLADGNSARLALTINKQKVTDAEFIQATLNGIGLDIEIVGLDATEMFSNEIEGKYELAWSGLSSLTSFYPRAYSQFHSSGLNLVKHTNSAFDGALVQGRDGATAEDRQDGWRRMLEIVRDDARSLVGVGGHHARLRNPVSVHDLQAHAALVLEPVDTFVRHDAFGRRLLAEERGDVADVMMAVEDVHAGDMPRMTISA